jgi:acetyltransferase
VRAAYQEILDSVARYRPGASVHGVAVEPMIARANGRELMVGVIRDPVFGPAIVFGAGGTTVEVHRDRAVALPPLDAFLIDELIRSTRISKLLGAFRHLPPVNLSALESVLLRVSEMVCELPALEELDINPLIVDESGVIAADARIVLRHAAPGQGSYGHMAIHPYPTQFVREWQLADGPLVTLRPIRPEDAQIEQDFVKGLSDESRYFRFMDTLRELTPRMLVRFTQIDYDREMAFIATIDEEGREVEIGVARYITNPDGETCEFALVVTDAWHRRGLGRRLMELLIEVAQQRGLKEMVGHILANNVSMLELCTGLGFDTVQSAQDPTQKRATLPLEKTPTPNLVR